MRLSTQLSRALATGKWRTEIYKFGHNPTAITGDAIWSAGGAYTGFLTTASTMEVISTSTADDDGGTGMQTAKIEGLDENWDYVEETVTLNGTSASTATTATFIRVTRVVGVTAGSGGVNAGVVTCRVLSAGATVATIEVGLGRSLMAIYTVPRNCTAVLSGAHARSDGANGVDLALLTRQAADTATSCLNAVSYHTALDTNGVLIESNNSIVLPGKTDVFFQVPSHASTGDATSARFSLTLIGGTQSVFVPDVR